MRRQRMHRVGVVLLACGGLAGLTACEDLAGFRTGPDDVFHGEVIGGDSEKVGSSFILAGFDSHTEMELTFDPALAATYATSDPRKVKSPGSPGEIHTFSCPAEEDFCPGRERTQGVFDHAALEPIANLAHDALSQYDFPGGGRIKNYLFGARFESAVASATAPVQRHAMVFLSLMESGGVEVRVIAPALLEDDHETELLPALFGVFMLEMRSR